MHNHIRAGYHLIAEFTGRLVNLYNVPSLSNPKLFSLEVYAPRTQHFPRIPAYLWKI